MNAVINLQGDWKFQLDAERIGVSQSFYSRDFTDVIKLPGTTSMAQKGEYSDKKEKGSLTDPYLFEGYAWYAKDVEISEADLGKILLLYLERTRVTRVWVDDVLVGDYNSLNTPHIYDLTPYVKTPKFRLTILVANVKKEEGKEDDPLAYPTGGGHLTSPDTQTNWNGILGRIELQVCAPVYISAVKTVPDIQKKEVTLELSTVNQTEPAAAFRQTVTVRARLKDISGYTGQETEACDYEVDFPAGEGTCSVTYPLGEQAVLWSEYSPVVYEVEISIGESGEKLTTTFGLREFSTNEKEFLINGRPTFLRGKHDGLIFPMTGAVPADVKEWIRVLQISKSYGINHYRFHTCCPPEAAFEAADLVGIYMEPQLPFWGTLAAPGDEWYNGPEQEYLIQEGWRIMEFFGNHASYCMMSLGNELWGSKERMSEILADYKKADTRHLYTQGSNNFQHAPVILPEEDFYVGVRLSKNRLFRGSYGMCDAPLGHVQTAEPSTRKNYDEVIWPSENSAESTSGGEDIEIQYGTGVKKVKAEEGSEVLVPHIPVVSHEIGQYCVYPDYKEIDKYTGVLKARNLELFRDHLASKGMADQSEDFFYNSGKLAVQCYKEELEAAARSESIAGYQILDIQDFTGQGTALVGILDAFMDSKGLVSQEEWAGFCSDAVLMAEFDSYVLTGGQEFTADLSLRYYRQESLAGRHVSYRMELSDGTVAAEGEMDITEDVAGLKKLGTVSVRLPQVSEPVSASFTLMIGVSEGQRQIRNEYELYLYPAEEDSLDLGQVVTLGSKENLVHVTNDFGQAEQLLSEGSRVLYLPEETKESLKGFYCTDFWCYPMFRDICEWMKKPVAVGTMGLNIQNEHPALDAFPSHTYATPQWYQLVSHCDCAILDDAAAPEYRPIVQMIDNFERNHKLGILFEGTVGNGRLMVCTIRLSELMNLTEPVRDESITAAGETVTYRDMSELPEVKQFTRSLVEYVTSDRFVPEQTLDMAKLRRVFVGE